MISEVYVFIFFSFYSLCDGHYVFETQSIGVTHIILQVVMTRVLYFFIIKCMGVKEMFNDHIIVDIVGYISLNLWCHQFDRF